MRRPTVLLLTESFDPATTKLLAEKLSTTFLVLDSPPCEGWTSRRIASFVELLPEGGADILLVNCGRQDLRERIPVDEFQKNLRGLVERARAIGASILWCGTGSPEAGAEIYDRAAADLMEAEGVMTANYSGFTASLVATESLAARPVNYFAEALGQWWAVCAKSNPAAVRTKLWPGVPPKFQRNGAERINDNGRVERISVPEITRFCPDVRGRGTAIIVFPGGGYGFTGFLRNARELATMLAPKEVSVFGLKYRTGRGAEIPLLDAARAVRWVRRHAAEWGIDPRRIGVAGISAGAHLALSLATNWTAGDPRAEDPVERVSSRPDFIAAFSVWNFGTTDSPFTFRGDVPPVFLRHAHDDPAFALAEKVAAQMRAAKVRHDVRFLASGGHGAFDLAPGNPGADWPDDFLTWSETLT